MKRKLLSVISAAMMVCIVFLCSCGEPSPQEVMNKINSGDQLEEADYYVMLDYLEDFVEMGEMSDGSYEEGQRAGRKYPYFMQFATALDNAPSDIRQDEDYQDIMTRFIIVMQN